MTDYKRLDRWVRLLSLPFWPYQIWWDRDWRPWRRRWP